MEGPNRKKNVKEKLPPTQEIERTLEAGDVVSFVVSGPDASQIYATVAFDYSYDDDNRSSSFSTSDLKLTGEEKSKFPSPLTSVDPIHGDREKLRIIFLDLLKKRVKGRGLTVTPIQDNAKPFNFKIVRDEVEGEDK